MHGQLSYVFGIQALLDKECPDSVNLDRDDYTWLAQAFLRSREWPKSAVSHVLKRGWNPGFL